MLRTSKPPPMSRSIDNAICATTSARPNGMRPTRAAPIRLRPCERNDVARSTRVARNAGNRPNSSTHASVIVAVKTSTRASGVVSMAIGLERRSRSRATRGCPRSPRTARARSTRSRATRPRRAFAESTARGRRRASCGPSSRGRAPRCARASRLDTFAQTTRMTKPTAAISTHSAFPYSARRSENPRAPDTT